MKPAEKMLDDDIYAKDAILIGSDFDFSAEKKKKESESDSSFVVGFVGDFFASYKTIKDHKEKFILIISLTIALGLSIFLALFLWNMYRTNRLDRIAKSLRQPNLSQSTLCSVTGSTNNGPRNGSVLSANLTHNAIRDVTIQSRAGSIDNGTINAYVAAASHNHPPSLASPAHSPNCPPGAIDIELEVGDHEVDTMFRDPGPKPLIVARATPPLQVCSEKIVFLLWHKRYIEWVFVFHRFHKHWNFYQRKVCGCQLIL